MKLRKYLNLIYKNLVPRYLILISTQMQRSSPTPTTKICNHEYNLHTQITWIYKQIITILQALKPWHNFAEDKGFWY